MAMPLAKVLTNRAEIIKYREKERMARYLRILFGKEKFGFQWVTTGTSYTDGKDIYALYPFTNPLDNMPFPIAEQRILRKATSIHERGHLEYDILDDYIAWVEGLSSNDKNEWLANEKYPTPWLQFFGNIMLDGRMENLVVIDHPTTKDYMDFKNYNWKVPIIEENEGLDPVQDFRTCFFRRAMGMTDYEGWIEESVALVKTIQPLIVEAREAESTKKCLDLTHSMLESVWPTLMEWMDLENQELDSFDYNDEHADSEWGEASEVEQNMQRVLVKIGISSEKGEEQQTAATSEGNDENNEEQSSNSSEDKDDSSSSEDVESDSEESADRENTSSSPEEEQPNSTPDFTKVLAIETKALEKDEKEADEAIGPYSEVTKLVTIWEHKENRKAYSSNVVIKPIDISNLDHYNSIAKEVKRYISPTAKALQGLLEPISDERRRNQRSGKLKANRVWRTDNLGDANVFDKRKKGTPGKNARILILNDISGSTSSEFPGTSHRIIDEMKRAQVLMVEACEKANIPVASYGFTEYFHEENNTVIHPFKPYNRFTNVEKGFIGGIEPKMGNRDTLSLQWAIDELATYPEDIRLLIMLSDGEPCFEVGEDYDTMRSIVQQAEKRGIDILCLYVGPQHPRVLENVRHMYPGCSIIVSKLLQRELTRHVKRIIRKRI